MSTRTSIAQNTANMVTFPYSSLLFYGAITLLVPSIIFSGALQDTYLDIITPNLVAKNNTSADVLILGGGHAGLSAALTLARHQHTTIILDSDKPRNRWGTPTHVLPTWEGKSPAAFKRSSLRELRRLGFAAYAKAEIGQVEKDNEGLFHATSTDGGKWTGRKLLLAIGAEHIYPDIPGYKENFPDRMLVNWSNPRVDADIS